MWGCVHGGLIFCMLMYVGMCTWWLDILHVNVCGDVYMGGLIFSMLMCVGVCTWWLDILHVNVCGDVYMVA